MVPPCAGINDDFIFLLVVEVDASHLRGIQSVAPLSEGTAAAAESHVVDVVGIAHSHDAHILVEIAAEESAGVTVVVTHTDVSVGHESFIHAGLHAEVEHGLLIAVIDAGDAGEVTLLLIGLHLINNTCGNILQGCLGVAGHKLLTVDQNLLHLLAVDGNLTVVANLCAGQPLHEFLNGGTLRCTVSCSIIYKGVFFQHHLLRLRRHLSALQHNGVGRHLDAAQSDGLFASDPDLLDVSLIADAGYLQQIGLCLLRHLEHKTATVIGQGTGDIRRVLPEQLHSCH